MNPTPLKHMKVNWDDEMPNIWKNKTCSKPQIHYQNKGYEVRPEILRPYRPNICGNTNKPEGKHRVD